MCRRDTSLWYSFLIILSIWFGFEVMQASQSKLGSIPSFYFLEEPAENCHRLLLECLTERTGETSAPGVFCVGRLFLMESTSLTHVSLLGLAISSCVRFGSLCLPRNWSLRYKICRP